MKRHPAYNAYLIGAILSRVVVFTKQLLRARADVSCTFRGAFVGHLVFHRTVDLLRDEDGKGAACH